MPSIRLFDRVLDRIQPLLTIDDLNINIYHPSVLPQASSLEIMDEENLVQFANDRLRDLQKKVEATRESVAIDDENLRQRKTLTKEMFEIQISITNSLCRYVEILAKLPEGELKKKIRKYLSAEDSPIEKDFPEDKIISELFKVAQQAISSYKEKEFSLETEGK